MEKLILEYNNLKNELPNKYKNYALSLRLPDNNQTKIQSKKHFEDAWSSYVNTIEDIQNETNKNINEKNAIEENNVNLLNRIEELRKNKSNNDVNVSSRINAMKQLELDYNVAYNNVYSKIFGYILGSLIICFLIYKFSSNGALPIKNKGKKIVQSGGAQINEKGFSQTKIAIFFALFYVLLYTFIERLIEIKNNMNQMIDLDAPLIVDDVEVNISIDSGNNSISDNRFKKLPTFINFLIPDVIKDLFRYYN